MVDCAFCGWLIRLFVFRLLVASPGRLGRFALDRGRFWRHGGCMTWSKSLAISMMAVFVGIALALLAGRTSQHVLSVPLPLACVAIAFGMQWVAFVPAALTKSEHFFDLWGATTYLVCIATAGLISASLTGRDALLIAFVAIWALRLGTFLFTRVRRQGGDSRFDEIKQSAPRFFLAWSLQGLWVSVTLLAVVLSIGAREQVPLGLSDLLGAMLWLVGFSVERVADKQKREFRRSNSKLPFISTGLWAWSRHPNYFGEIVLWTGLAIMSSASMTGLSWLGLVSPFFVFLLLRYGSGIPILEERCDQKFGNSAAYQTYKKNTPLLIMLPPR